MLRVQTSLGKMASGWQHSFINLPITLCQSTPVVSGNAILFSTEHLFLFGLSIIFVHTDSVFVRYVLTRYCGVLFWMILTPLCRCQTSCPFHAPPHPPVRYSLHGVRLLPRGCQQEGEAGVWAGPGFLPGKLLFSAPRLNFRLQSSSPSVASSVVSFSLEGLLSELLLWHTGGGEEKNEERR